MTDTREDFSPLVEPDRCGYCGEATEGCDCAYHACDLLEEAFETFKHTGSGVYPTCEDAERQVARVEKFLETSYRAQVRRNQLSAAAEERREEEARASNDSDVLHWPECSQPDCSEPAYASYVWPGKAERRNACIVHLTQVQGIASAMGFQLGDVRATADEFDEQLRALAKRELPPGCESEE